MTASSVWLALFGALLLFAPQEVSGLLGPEASNHPLMQLLGATFLGFAVMNWIARDASLGGIYGRSVVAGNQTQLTVGAVLLVKRGVEVGSNHPTYWVLTGLYVLGAAFFGYLTFAGSGLKKHS
jgi:hypothetical protein